MPNIVVAALYKFAKLPDYAEMQSGLLDFCIFQGLNGTILLATEGINGTVAGSRAAIDALALFLRSDARLADIELKESATDVMPFDRMKVKLKKEIVTLGVAGTDPNKRVGTYVTAEHWNALISDPDVVLLDTRNSYEHDIGTFPGAIDPHTTSFRQFPAYVQKNLDPAQHKKIAMFCTGGIRCEKPALSCSNKGLKRFTICTAGYLNTWKKFLRIKACGKASVSCLTSEFRSVKGCGWGHMTNVSAVAIRFLPLKRLRQNTSLAYPARIVSIPCPKKPGRA